ncbi:MAG: hypothetical protein AMXMBFR23_17040 [Chloroflexota bacterium]
MPASRSDSGTTRGVSVMAFPSSQIETHRGVPTVETPRLDVLGGFYVRQRYGPAAGRRRRYWAVKVTWRSPAITV